MRTNLESTDTEFLSRLHRQGASSVQQLCATMGVTATAVRQRISRLQSEGYVDRETIRAQRGRPYHVYRVTAAGLRQLGDDYGELAQILWKRVREIDDPNVQAQLMAGIRQSLVQRYQTGGDSGSIIERFERLREALDRQGLDVEVQTRAGADGQFPILREHCCPYHDLAVADSSICDLEQSVFEEVLGVPVRLTQCCRDGDACCEFEPVTAG